MSNNYSIYHGYMIYYPTSGGKAGTGKNSTSALQVRNAEGTFELKQFRFKVKDVKSRVRAQLRAQSFIDRLINMTETVDISKHNATRS